MDLKIDKDFLEIASSDHAKNFITFLQGKAYIAQITYHQDLINTMKNLNIYEQYILIKENAEIILQSIDSFKIDQDRGEIILQKDNKIIKRPLLQVNSFLQNTLGLTYKNVYYFLILGFFALPNQYETIQLYNMIYYLK